MAAALLVCLLATSVAQAGNAYVLDAFRPGAPTTTPGIVRLSDQLRYTLSPGPGAEMLQAPVGIDYDEASETLLVTDSEGYPGTYGGDPCVGGCGALLRIDPATNPAQVTLVSGPGRAPGGNTWENPYGVLVRSGVGDILVSDTSSNRIVSVDPSTGAQAQFNQPSGYARGLRNPWGMSIDPTTGDILVANAGNQFSPFDGSEFGPGFVVPDRCRGVGTRGYVVRFNPNGVPLTMYCSKAFSRPRDVLVNGDGVIFVLDPITYAFNPGIGFGTLFRINPAKGFAKPLSAGGSMATPSGLDFNAAGSHLVVADETLFPYSGPCPDGCGGVVQVNANGGEQKVLAARGPGAWVDPIDIAVDRDGQGTPTLKTQTIPEFLHLNRDEGQARPSGNDVRIPVFPLQAGNVVSVYCIGNKRCPGHDARHLIRRFTVPEDRSEVTVTVAAGSPNASIARCKRWPHCRRQIPYGVTVADGKNRKRRAKRSVEAVAAKKKGKKHKKKKPSAQRDNGRYYDFVLTSDPKQVVLVTRSGCLKPGETTVSRKKPKTVIGCPAP